MATLTLTLNGGDIKKAVKADTYITGQIDKAADMTKNAALAYNEQAGDDSYHEVKLYRTMKGAVGKFEANMAEYVDPGSGQSAVADTLTATTSEGNFNITIPVGSRFYAAFANTLSTLAQEYIINMMLYSWWQSIKPAFAKDYYQFAQESLEMVRKTLSKTPPDTSLESYTDVSGNVETRKDPGLEADEAGIPNMPVNDTFDLRTLITNPNSLTLAYTTDDQTVASINGNGLITAVDTGTATIKATFAGDETYKPAELEFTVTVE